MRLSLLPQLHTSEPRKTWCNVFVGRLKHVWLLRRLPLVVSRRGRAEWVLWERWWDQGEPASWFPDFYVLARVRKRGFAFCVHGRCPCLYDKSKTRPTGPATTWAERSSRDQSPASTVRKVDAGLREVNPRCAAPRRRRAAAQQTRPRLRPLQRKWGSVVERGKWKVTGPTATCAATGTGCFRTLR